MDVTDFSDNENTDLGFPLSLILNISNTIVFEPISTIPYNGFSLFSVSSLLFFRITLFLLVDMFSS